MAKQNYANQNFGQNRGQGRNFEQNLGQGHGGNNMIKAQMEFQKTPSYDSKWITDGADGKMVEFAEAKGEFMAKNGLTNSKIRSIYGEIKRIQMGFEDNKKSFYLLKPKVAYAYGRDDKNEGLYLFKLIFDRAYQDVDLSKIDTYMNFCNFIEAILAYHKAFGGKD